MIVNWLDIVLLLVILSSFVSGLRSGFARVVVGLVATLFGLLAGFWFYRMVASPLLPLVQSPTAANIIGFLVIFIGILLVGALVASILSSIFKWVGLSWFNHLLGGVAGVLRGGLVVAALVAVVVAFTPSPPPSFLHDSRVLPYAMQMSGWLAEFAPRELKDAFTQQIDNLKQLWAPPQKRPLPKEV
jgi:membrane protein required for colicin V production